MVVERLGLLVGACGFTVLYLGLLVVRRLVLSPLARFPGPRLAGLSNWYEFYHDVVRQGQFTRHIQELHKTYGPIVRITPTELHIDDPDYFDVLYAREGRRDRYAYTAHRFGVSTDLFSTTDHDLHRNRRKAISPFFSASNISEFEPVIQEAVSKLCRRLAAFKDGQIVRLCHAWMAMTTDIITEYAFAKSYDQLDSPDFEDTLHEAMLVAQTTGFLNLHFPIIIRLLSIVPDWFVRRVKPAVLPVFGVRKDIRSRVGEIRNGINQGHKVAKHRTIFHELLNSDLPETEKTNTRLGDEAYLIIGAGLVTTAWALSVATVHLTKDKDALAKLREEIATAKSPLEWHHLEKLPYLNGCVHESIRLSHGVVSRDPRLAPDTELQYGKWTIPRNTPVSMTTVHVLMNETIFPNPQAFVPERWIDNPGLQRYFVAFGKGSRQCLGINLAMAELYVAMARIFSRFDFELFETDESDILMKHAYLLPFPKWESKGVRVTVKNDLSSS